MKKPLLLFTCIFFFFNYSHVSAQLKAIVENSYTIQSNRTIGAAEMPFYKKSIEAVDFEKYRLKTKDVELTFNNGFKLILISAERCLSLGLNISPLDYTDSVPPDYIYPQFNIDGSGIVTTMHKIKATKSELKNNLK